MEYAQQKIQTNKKKLKKTNIWRCPFRSTWYFVATPGDHSSVNNSKVQRVDPRHDSRVERERERDIQKPDAAQFSCIALPLWLNSGMHAFIRTSSCFCFFCFFCFFSKGKKSVTTKKNNKKKTNLRTCQHAKKHQKPVSKTNKDQVFKMTTG